MKDWLKTILLLFVAALLTRFIPFSYLFRTLDTMVHEFGHAVVTLLTSGEVIRIDLNADHSGVTYSTLTSNWAAILTALAGYIGASLFAVLLFYLFYKRLEQLGFAVMTLIAAVMVALYVHGGYGFWWLAGFILLNAIIMFFAGNWLRKGYYLLLAFITLEESVLAPSMLMLAAVTSPGQAGDASNLAASTFIPAPVWAALFLLVALWCARLAVSLFLRRSRGQSSRGDSRRRQSVDMTG